MRLDKFLKVSRLVKRRTVANELCDASRVTVDGRSAKASTEVAVGQTLLIHFGTRRLTVRVERVPERPQVSVQEASTLFTVLQEEQLRPSSPTG